MSMTERDLLARQYAGQIASGIVSTIPISASDLTMANPFKGFESHRKLIAAISVELAYSVADLVMEGDQEHVDNVLRSERLAYLEEYNAQHADR